MRPNQPRLRAGVGVGRPSWANRLPRTKNIKRCKTTLRFISGPKQITKAFGVAKTLSNPLSNQDENSPCIGVLPGSRCDPWRGKTTTLHVPTACTSKPERHWSFRDIRSRAGLGKNRGHRENAVDFGARRHRLFFLPCRERNVWRAASARRTWTSGAGHSQRRTPRQFAFCVHQWPTNHRT